VPIQWVPGALSLTVKWQGREADHLPPSSAKVVNAWSYTSTPQYTFMAWYSIKKAQGRLYFTFTSTLKDGVSYSVMMLIPSFTKIYKFVQSLLGKTATWTLNTISLSSML